MGEIRLTIWNEYRHEKTDEAVRKVYPEGIHATIAEHFRRCKDMRVRTATLEEPEHGLTEEALADTDVLIWWGHIAHREVDDAIVDRVQRRIIDGMGLVALHSAHLSKVFRRMMGTSCMLHWREADEKERLWVVNPAHPITAGMGAYMELAEAEMYGEFFDVPAPEELVFVSWFEGGEVFRSGAVWTRGKGRIFYFRPGHETYPHFRNAEVMGVIERGVRYVVFRGNTEVGCKDANVKESLEPIRPKRTSASGGG